MVPLDRKKAATHNGSGSAENASQSCRGWHGGKPIVLRGGHESCNELWLCRGPPRGAYHRRSSSPFRPPRAGLDHDRVSNLFRDLHGLLRGGNHTLSWRTRGLASSQCPIDAKRGARQVSQPLLRKKINPTRTTTATTITTTTATTTTTVLLPE